MVMISLLATGIGMFLVGTTLVYKTRPLTEREYVDKAYEHFKLQRKKEKLMPMKNADINLFGVIKY